MSSEALKQVLEEALGAAGYRALFVSSGEEAVSQVFWTTYLQGMRQEGKNHVLLPESASRAIYDSAARLEQLGATAKSFGSNMSDLLSIRTALVSLEAAQGLTGEPQPLEEIAKLAKEWGAPLHLDVTAALGKMWMDFDLLQPDYISYDGSLPGTGVLWVKEGAAVEPLINGSDGLRAGAVDPKLCLGLSREIEDRLDNFHSFSMEYAQKRAEFIQMLEGAQIFSSEKSLPHIIVFGFEGLHGELLAFHLHEAGLDLSFGGGKEQPLHRLVGSETALSIDLTKVRTSAIDLIVEVARSLRAKVSL